MSSADADRPVGGAGAGPAGGAGFDLERPDAQGEAARDGYRIAWRSYGEGPPVLLIMGLMGSGRLWYRLLPHLAGRYRAIVIDNRGTGGSASDVATWTMADMADDAAAALADAGEASAHVVGASMGGMIAQTMALDHSERVRSLVLACTTPGGGNGGPPPWRLLSSLALRPFVGTEKTFPLVAPVLYSEQSRDQAPDRVQEDLEVRNADSTPAQTAVGQLSAIVRYDVRDRLGEIAVPTLVVHGEEDTLVSPDRGRALADGIPGARLALIPDAGHVLFTDAEPAVAGAIVGFLDEQTGGQST